MTADAGITAVLAEAVRKKAVARADEVGHMDARGAAIWDVANWLAEDPEATDLIAAHVEALREADRAAAATYRCAQFGCCP